MFNRYIALRCFIKSYFCCQGFLCVCERVLLGVLVLEIKPRALYVLSRCSTTKLPPQSLDFLAQDLITMYFRLVLNLPCSPKIASDSGCCCLCFLGLETWTITPDIRQLNVRSWLRASDFMRIRIKFCWYLLSY